MKNLKNTLRYSLYLLLVICVFCGDLQAQDSTECEIIDFINTEWIEYERECYNDSSPANVYVNSDGLYVLPREVYLLDALKNEYKIISIDTIYNHRQPDALEFILWVRKKYGY